MEPKFYKVYQVVYKEYKDITTKDINVKVHNQFVLSDSIEGALISGKIFIESLPGNSFGSFYEITSVTETYTAFLGFEQDTEGALSGNLPEGWKKIPHEQEPEEGV